MVKDTKSIRDMFLNFFKRKAHRVLESSSIIPTNDSSLLFTNAGMNQFKELYLGIERPMHTKVSTSQYCLRAGGKHNDLDIVGFTNRHHTLFEMLGNFSFGGYFKYETINLAWILLASEGWFNIQKDKLLVTAYYLDRETYDMWVKEIGIPKERIAYIGDNSIKEPYVSDNYWCMGTSGPCGPCSEVFYDYGEQLFGCLSGSEKGCGKRYAEAWSLVFMQHNRQHNRLMVPLSKPAVDTGMGLERVAAVLQRVGSTFKTDMYRNTIAIIKGSLNINYLNGYPYIIADHIRSYYYVVKSGVCPSNEGRGYVLRRVIRRMIRYLNLLGIEKPYLHTLIYVLKDMFIDYFEDKPINISHIESALLHEESRYYNSIKKGLEVFLNKIYKKEVKEELDGKAVLFLYDTYGLPTDFIVEACAEKDINIDKARPIAINPMELQESFPRKGMAMYPRERASEKVSIKGSYISVGYNKLEYTTHIKGSYISVGYNKLEYTTHIKGISINNNKVTSIYEGQSGVLILTKTALYPDSSGQAGDIGELITIKALFKITNTKNYNNTILHIGKVMYGFFILKEAVIATATEVCRKSIKANHSAVHMINRVLCSYIKRNHIQKTSYIDANYVCFGFICGTPKAKDVRTLKRERGLPLGMLLTNEEAIIIEEEVNTHIINNLLTATKLISVPKRNSSIVRIANIYGLSIEACKGMYTSRTGDIGLFYIDTQYTLSIPNKHHTSRVSTGRFPICIVANSRLMLKNLKEVTYINTHKLCAQLNQLRTTYKRIEREANHIRERQLVLYVEALIKEFKDYKDKIVVKTIGSFYTSLLYVVTKCLIANLRTKVIILNTKQSNRIRFIIGITDDLLCYINAKDIVGYLVVNLKGKGGGSLKIAQGVGDFIVFRKGIHSVSNLILGKVR